MYDQIKWLIQSTQLFVMTSIQFNSIIFSYTRYKMIAKKHRHENQRYDHLNWSLELPWGILHVGLICQMFYVAVGKICCVISSKILPEMRWQYAKRHQKNKCVISVDADRRCHSKENWCKCFRYLHKLRPLCSSNSSILFILNLVCSAGGAGQLQNKNHIAI